MLKGESRLNEDLYLVDGTFEVFRCFAATPRHTNHEGQEMGAVRGLLQTMVSSLKREGMGYMAVAFDPIGTRVRPDDRSDDGLLRSQFPLAAEALQVVRHHRVAHETLPG